MEAIVAVVHPQRDKWFYSAFTAFFDDYRRRVVARVGEGLGISILIRGICLHTSVPCLARGETKLVGLSRPFQNIALILRHVSAPEAEKQGVHPGILQWREHKRNKLIPR